MPGSVLFNELLAQEKENANYKNSIKIINLLTELSKENPKAFVSPFETVFEDIFGPHLGWKYRKLTY